MRAFCILCLATGNVGKPGTGANIFRGHDNVQGATDIGLDVVTLPFYYGLTEGAWKHWARVWEVEYEWLQGRFDVRKAGAARTRSRSWRRRASRSTRWFDARARCRRTRSTSATPPRRCSCMGHGGNTRHPHPGVDEGPGEARPPGRRRSAPDHLGVARGQAGAGQHLPPADLHAVRDGGLAHRLQPLAAMGRADRRADLRVEGRLRGHVPAGAEARLRRPDVQEHHGRGRPAGARGRPARDQPRQLVDRLLRPVAGAAQGAHEEPGTSSTWSPCARRRTTRRSAATTTACPGRAGASRRSAIPAPPILYNTACT